MHYFNTQSTTFTPPPEPHTTETILSDNSVFECVLSPCSSILHPQPTHGQLNDGRSPTLAGSSPLARAESMLSPHDILYALNTLAAVRYDDVRADIISGLLELLQVSSLCNGRTSRYDIILLIMFCLNHLFMFRVCLQSA